MKKAKEYAEQYNFSKDKENELYKIIIEFMEEVTQVKKCEMFLLMLVLYQF